MHATAEQLQSLTIIRHSAVADALTVLRCRDTTTVDFRARARTIARALAYEATRDLPVEERAIETPMGAFTGIALRTRVIATPILRAGLGMLDGFLDIIPAAATGFIGLKRNEETLLPYEYYRNIPDPRGAHFFLLDPMLATGGSAVAALGSLPLDRIASVTLVTIICAPEGVAAVSRAFPQVKIFTASLDERLNDIGYIVPGLGDAGDRLCDT
jgi:uracil phosphoribosyltransferase